MAMLEVKDLSVYYGVIQALKGISFEVNEGDVIALIGANGAGKTTTLHTITGLIPSKSGSITFEGKDITKVPGYKLVPMGIAHVPEGRRVFAQLSVLQNLKMGAYTRNDKQEIEDTLTKIYKRFPRLEERKNQLAGTLSGGEQQMLAMGRALMSHPRLIVMDEPSMGLRYYQGDQRRRHHCTFGGAECEKGAVNRQQGLCAGDRKDCAEGRRQRAYE